MKIHRRVSKTKKVQKKADVEQPKKIKDDKNDQYTVRSMLSDLDKWENFLSM